jgi:hypothetical protein
LATREGARSRILIHDPAGADHDTGQRLNVPRGQEVRYAADELIAEETKVIWANRKGCMPR